MRSSRRDFVKTLVGGGAGLSLGMAVPSFARAQGAFSSAITTTKLTDSILLISGAGGNVLAVVGPESVLLVDSGSAERTDELLKVVSGQSGGRPVGLLINTHWHLEHTGGNDAIG